MVEPGPLRRLGRGRPRAVDRGRHDARSSTTPRRPTPWWRRWPPRPGADRGPARRRPAARPRRARRGGGGRAAALRRRARRATARATRGRQPCAHALAVIYQLTWLVEVDPFVLVHLRGLTARGPAGPAAPSSRPAGTTPDARASGEASPDLTADINVDLAVDGMRRAARLLEEWETGAGRSEVVVGADAGLEHRPGLVVDDAGVRLDRRRLLELDGPGQRCAGRRSRSPTPGGTRPRSASSNIPWRLRIHTALCVARRHPELAGRAGRRCPGGRTRT